MNNMNLGERRNQYSMILSTSVKTTDIFHIKLTCSHSRVYKLPLHKDGLMKIMLISNSLRCNLHIHEWRHINLIIISNVIKINATQKILQNKNQKRLIGKKEMNVWQNIGKMINSITLKLQACIHRVTLPLFCLRSTVITKKFS